MKSGRFFFKFRTCLAVVCFKIKNLALFFSFHSVMYMSTSQLQYVRYGLPTYWMAVCVSNGVHNAVDDWECHENDAVECVIPNSKHLIEVSESNFKN